MNRQLPRMRQGYFIRKRPIPSKRSFSLRFNGFWYWDEIKGYGRWVGRGMNDTLEQCYKAEGLEFWASCVKVDEGKDEQK